MSYSYIKSVFPNFETSKVYSEDLYNISSLQKQEQTQSKVQIPTEKIPKPFEEQYVSPFNLNKNTVQTEQKNDKDNLRFYNLPYVPVQPVQEKNEENIHKSKKIVEGFEDTEENIDHNKYILHILDCKKCKESLMKQLNLLDDKIKMESYMELASYIIFGIFMIILIDTLNKK